MSSLFASELHFWANVSLFSIGMVVLAVMAVVQLFHSISDLCTAERTSVKKVEKPQKSRTYILCVWVTCSMFWLYLICTIFNVIAPWTAIAPIEYCDLLLILGSSFYATAKTLTWLVFVLRLRLVYHSTAFEYPPRVLLSAGICLCFIGMSAIVLNALLTGHSAIVFSQHSHLCIPYYPKWLMLLSTIGDTLLSLTFIAMFSYPIYKLSQRRGARSDDLLRVSKKVQVLTCTAIVSSMFMFGFLMVTDSVVFVPLDNVVNCVCVGLMCPYYSDTIYYNVCCLCNRDKHTEQPILEAARARLPTLSVMSSSTKGVTSQSDAIDTRSRVDSL